MGNKKSSSLPFPRGGLGWGKNPDQLKEIFKSAIIELIRDNRKEVSEFLAEIIEDVAMDCAIAEGETTELVSRESIFQLLEPKA